MLKTNKDYLVMQSVQGTIHHPLFASYRVDVNGQPFVVPATGGISYNVKIGDPAFGLVGDHVEPGVSIYNEKTHESNALNVFACIGNEAKVITGDAKGAKGYVTGSHGGIEHVMIYFDQETLELLTLDDKILIKGHGQGLALTDYPNIKVMSIDPDLFEKLNIKEENGKLFVPVAAEIPQHLMGSGVGSTFSQKGDYDIITSDREEIARLGIDKLCFGDLVFLRDCDNTYGLGGVKKGAGSIGVIIHSDCIKSGHGPGVSIIMSSKDSVIEPLISETANIANYLGVK